MTQLFDVGLDGGDAIRYWKARAEAAEAKVQRIEQFTDEMRSVDTPLTQSVANLIEGALVESPFIHGVGR